MKHTIDNAQVIYGDFGDFKKKPVPTKLAYHNLKYVRRSNDLTRTLSSKARSVFAVIASMIKREGMFIENHSFLSKITECKYDQNNNILNQLRDVLDIQFYYSITIDYTKYYNVFVMDFTQDAERILENPAAFYSKNFLQKRIANSTTNQTGVPLSVQTDVPIGVPNFFGTTTIYDNKITLEEELQSNYSSSKVDIDKDIFKEDIARERAKEISPPEEKLLEMETQSGSNLEFNSSYEVLDREPLQELSQETGGEVSVETPPVVKEEVIRDFQIAASVEPESIQPNACYPRHLKDFHPLTPDDHQQLVKASKRNFTLAAMNEILLDMSVRVSGKDFVSKGSFLGYMTKVYANEKRSEQLLNQEGFKLRNNMPEEEREMDEQEEFLSKVLLDRDTSLDGLFKRSIADREVISESLLRKTAFNLLKAYVSSKTSGEYLILNLRFYVELTPNDKEYIMKKGRSIYESQRNSDPDSDFSSMAAIAGNLLNHTATGIKNLTKLIINMPSSFTKTVSNVSSSFRSPDNVWWDIRNDLTQSYENYKFSDQHWISKFKAVVDEENKVITLKTSSKFFFDEVYTQSLYKYFGYSSEGEGYVLEDSALRKKYPYKVKIALVPETEINDRTEVKTPSMHHNRLVSQDTLVGSNTKVLELSNYVRKAYKRGEMILAACEITELTPKKVNILVEKGNEIDESAKSFLRESIKFIYGDDVEIVTKATRS